MTDRGLLINKEIEEAYEDKSADQNVLHDMNVFIDSFRSCNGMLDKLDIGDLCYVYLSEDNASICTLLNKDKMDVTFCDTLGKTARLSRGLDLLNCVPI